jgi:hypothetical protein
MKSITTPIVMSVVEEDVAGATLTGVTKPPAGMFVASPSNKSIVHCHETHIVHATRNKTSYIFFILISCYLTSPDTYPVDGIAFYVHGRRS